MAFRDDLDAAHARISELEQELRDSQARTEKLKRELQEARRPTKPAVKRADLPQPAEARQLSKHLYYVRPWSYFPLWEKLWHGIRVGATARLPPAKTDSLLLLLGYYLLAFPVFYLVLLPIFFLLVVPYNALFALLSTPLVVLIQMLRGLKLSAYPPERQRPLNPQSREMAILNLTMILLLTSPLLVIVIGFLASIYTH